MGEFERFIQTIKRKCRCISSEMREIGITHLPVAILKAMVGFVLRRNVAERLKEQVGDIARVLAQRASASMAIRL